MNRIAVINGSPKSKESASAALIEKLQGFLDGQTDMYRAACLLERDDAQTLPDILCADALLIVFPLYVDALPAPLIGLLERLERAAESASAPLPVLYAICNCGFYEAEHTAPALGILRSFARRAGLKWGYGLGIGCGGLSAGMYAEKGPAAGLYAAMRALAGAIGQNSAAEREDVFVTPGIPRMTYKFFGNMGWRQRARKSGAGGKLYAKPHEK